MKITKIDLLRVRGLSAGFEGLFCRVYTDSGIYGDGEAAIGYGRACTATFGAMQDMSRYLIGADPLEHEKLWHKMYTGCFWGRNGGAIVYGAISALDVALWDIKGKYYHAPLYELLGGKHRNELRCYASQIQKGYGINRKPAATPEEYADYAVKAVNQGFDSVKLDFFIFDEYGGKIPEIAHTGILSPHYMQMLESRIAATRDAIGPMTDIILENHAYTDLQSAIQIGKMAAKYGIAYYEEPTLPDADLLAQVHQETGLPIASGERMYGRQQFNKCFQKNAIQIAQPDIGNTGGITEAKKICDLASIYESSVQLHVCGSQLITAATLQMESTLPNFVIHEYNVNTMMPDMRELTVYDYQPVNGSILVPDLPGIGNEISEKAFQKAEIITIE